MSAVERRGPLTEKRKSILGSSVRWAVGSLESGILGFDHISILDAWSWVSNLTSLGLNSPLDKIKIIILLWFFVRVYNNERHRLLAQDSFSTVFPGFFSCISTSPLSQRADVKVKENSSGRCLAPSWDSWWTSQVKVSCKRYNVNLLFI